MCERDGRARGKLKMRVGSCSVHVMYIAVFTAEGAGVLTCGINW